MPSTIRGVEELNGSRRFQWLITHHGLKESG